MPELFTPNTLLALGLAVFLVPLAAFVVLIHFGRRLPRGGDWLAQAAIASTEKPVSTRTSPITVRILIGGRSIRSVAPGSCVNQCRDICNSDAERPQARLSEEYAPQNPD